MKNSRKSNKVVAGVPTNGDVLTIAGVVPEGWALIEAGMEVPPIDEVKLTAQVTTPATPVVVTTTPRKSPEVKLSFCYRSQSPAFLEVMLHEDEAGRVSWLRKSALKTFDVTANGQVVVEMPRALAVRRKLLGYEVAAQAAT